MQSWQRETLWERLLVCGAVLTLLSGCHPEDAVVPIIPASEVKTVTRVLPEAEQAGDPAATDATAKSDTTQTGTTAPASGKGVTQTIPDEAKMPLRPAVKLPPILPYHDTTPQDFQPVDSGNGLVVCEPIARATDAATTEFATGCGRWLHFYLSGQGELGQTPPGFTLRRVVHEMNRPDLRLTAEEALSLATHAGATHAAIGEITGNATRCTLTYQVLAVPANKKVGAPLTVTGSEAAVVAALPDMARRTAILLGVKAPRLPAQTGLSPDELRTIGQWTWADAHDGPPYTAPAPLQQLALRDPLAGLLALSNGRNRRTEARALQRLVQQAPDNPLVLNEIAAHEFYAPWACYPEVVAALERFPHNASLLISKEFLLRTGKSWGGAEDAGILAIRSAPRNPETWQTFVQTVSSASEAIRYGRYAAAISSEEYARLNKMYSLEQWAAEQCVKLDPASPSAWSSLATAATFAGDPVTADRAMQRGLALNASNIALLHWGLQMYQPKWGGDPAALKSVANKAAKANLTNIDDRLSIVAQLKDAGFSEMTQPLLEKLEADLQARIQAHPQEGYWQEMLARAYTEHGKLPQADEEYKTLLRLIPNNFYTHSGYAEVLVKRGHIEEAIAQYREMIRIAPYDVNAHYHIGWWLKNSGHLPEAETEMRKAIALNPNFANGHYGLGEVLVVKLQNEAAIPEFREALRLERTHAGANAVLANLLTDKKENAEAVRLINVALLSDPKDMRAHSIAEYVFGEAKMWEESARECRYVLASDPNDVMAHENLGDALYGLNQKAAAKAEWRWTLAHDPNGGAGKEAREMLAAHP